MYTLKCYKHNGIKHVYAARMYTIHPPKANAQGEIITVVESSNVEGSSRPLHHVSLDPLDFTYKEIFVENMSGKTMDVIRGSTKAYDNPDAGQAFDIEYPRKPDVESIAMETLKRLKAIDTDTCMLVARVHNEVLESRASEAGVSKETLLPVEDVVVERKIIDGGGK